MAIETGKIVKLGELICNRCRLEELQNRAKERGMVITMRKSLYEDEFSKGIDIYIHPKHVHIPSHHKYAHRGMLGSIEFMSKVLPEDDPDKWWEAWLSDIPPKCVCRIV